eukprot:TRINITY_DN41699_c0_g1_i2.p1 TRINITY_DN41699_c0_g1~~TRINITY_DN41699_c0_g1_i2.p1  ORF type:complete len:113 (-),score=9.12 TRINITY_DN41699_c0_g1_i2:52-390(-)
MLSPSLEDLTLRMAASIQATGWSNIKHIALHGRRSTQPTWLRQVPGPCTCGMTYRSNSKGPRLGRSSYTSCLLYTSDAADEEDSGDLGGRRIIKKKKRRKTLRMLNEVVDQT